jgi:hypothetical protein
VRRLTFCQLPKKMEKRYGVLEMSFSFFKKKHRWGRDTQTGQYVSSFPSCC